MHFSWLARKGNHLAGYMISRSNRVHHHFQSGEWRLGFRFNVLILSEFFLSGQTTHVVELSRHLYKRGHDVTVVAGTKSNPVAWNGYKPILEKSGVRCLTLSDFSLEELLDLSPPDVVHVHSSTMIAQAVSGCERRGIPVIVTCHGLHVAQKAPEVARADRIIAVGEKVRLDLTYDGIDWVDLIPNGVDTDMFRPYRGFNVAPGPPAPFVTAIRIGYFGRVDRAKQNALNCLVRAVREIPRARLTVVSNKPEYAGAQGGVVACKPWTFETAPLMRRQAIVIGTGRVIREAMASGCIAMVMGEKYGGVVSRATIHRFLRRSPQPGHGRPLDPRCNLSFSGFEGCVPDENTLRRDLLKIIQNQRQSTAMKHFSRRFARAFFGIDRMVQQICGVYNGALSQARAV